MSKIIAFISQKGGVSKSTLARGIAREGLESGLDVKVADLDVQQGTFTEWHRIRLSNGFDSIGSVELFSNVKNALKQAKDYDLLVIDGGARASEGTLEISKVADLVVLPTSASRDDLTPAIRLAFDLQKKGIDNKKIVFALSKVTTEAEIEDARDYIKGSGFQVANGCLYEKPAYRQAQNEGLTITETKYRSLNIKADELLTSITELLLKD
ncbi:MAG: AAA family ATPase [Mycoplasmataceae bacterium]|nr:AAA family ATPase [Mycoplasmataceae bacterium]